MRNILTTILLVAIVSSSFGVETLRVVAAGTSQDQFIVSQQVIDSPDVTAPSVPTNLTATAVSTSQINLSWNASTDNASVAGYQVFRDGVFVATSTATTYSDTGLTASTLYSYTVTAFDPSVNISAESAPASATTFAVTPPDQGDDGASGGGRVILLRYLSVSPDLQSALIQILA
jgi:fibronectin type 3 domain-containing protein